MDGIRKGSIYSCDDGNRFCCYILHPPKFSRLLSYLTKRSLDMQHITDAIDLYLDSPAFYFTERPEGQEREEKISPRKDDREIMIYQK